VIRTLVLIAIVGFVLAVACFAGAFAIVGGPFFIDDTGHFHHTDWRDDVEVRRVAAFHAQS